MRKNVRIEVEVSLHWEDSESEIPQSSNLGYVIVPLEIGIKHDDIKVGSY